MNVLPGGRKGLAAEAVSVSGQSYRIDGRSVPLGNLDKLYWPEEGYRKGDLIAYYVAVSPWLLPHLRDRPLVLHRFPDGTGGKSFYQKECPAHAPPWLRRVPLGGEKGGRVINYCLADDAAGLAWLAGQGCIELHAWLSRAGRPGEADFLVWDFDPMPGTGFAEASRLALALRQALQELGLRGYPKTSGASGVHVYLPVQAGYSYATVRVAAGLLAGLLARVAPRLATVERAVRRRGSQVYVDYLQNARGKTLASVYSVRPLPGAPVSTPVTWEELAEGVDPRQFTIKTVPARLESVGDLFAPVLTDRQSLAPLLGALRKTSSGFARRCRPGAHARS